jgi:2-amino-4-hydroxy-6-hydroxymethyldihydropteridine diphosphokinase
MESEASTAAPVLDAVIGLGANIGSPEGALRRAIAELARIGSLTAVSPLYRSAPVGGPPQPDFLNAAARLLYRGDVEGLLREAHRIEQLAGRERRERWGPRTLDLDILWISGVSVHREGLHVPHARLRERAFALQPMVDVAPDAADPADGTAYRDVLGRQGTAGIERLRVDWVEADAGHVSPGMDRPRL